MRLFGRAKSFERDDLGFADRRDRRDAGADSVPVQKDGAGTALRQSASEFRTAQAEVIAQRIEQHAVGLYLDGVIRAVHVQADVLGHEELPGRARALGGWADNAHAGLAIQDIPRRQAAGAELLALSQRNMAVRKSVEAGPHIEKDITMSGNWIASAAIVIAFLVTAGPAPVAVAQTAHTAPKGQSTGTPSIPNGGASEQNKSGGQFSPGGVPTKNQATTQPSVPPNGVGATQTKRPRSDFGPGGVPTTGQAATTPSRQGPAGTATPSDSRSPK